MKGPSDPIEPVKLAIVTETFPPEINGVAMTFGVIARELGRRKHAVTVYRPWRPDLPDAAIIPEFARLPFLACPFPAIRCCASGLPARRRLTAALARGPPDLVHVATEGPLGASAVTAARSLRLPVTSSFHTNFHAYMPATTALHRCAGRPRLAAPRAQPHPPHLRADRGAVPELAALGFTGLGVLSRGVDTQLFSPLRTPRCAPSWGAANGRIGRAARRPDGRGEELPAALPRLRRHARGQSPAALRPGRRRPAAAETAKGAPRLHLRRLHLPREALGRHYASADIYVHASLTETFGNVLTEAMASGLAVASFDYAAARQFVRHGENGLAVPAPSRITDRRRHRPGARRRAARPPARGRRHLVHRTNRGRRSSTGSRLTCQPLPPAHHDQNS
jgi:glycosyltransferase involved in cell wall biosynthesis